MLHIGAENSTAINKLRRQRVSREREMHMHSKVQYNKAVVHSDSTHLNLKYTVTGMKWDCCF